MESGNDSYSDDSFGFFGKKREKPKQAEPKKKKVEKPTETIAKGSEKEIKKDTEDKATKEPEEKKSMEPIRQAEESKNKDPIDRILPFKKEENTPGQDTGKKTETNQEEHKEENNKGQVTQTNEKKTMILKSWMHLSPDKTGMQLKKKAMMLKTKQETQPQKCRKT